MKKRNRSRTFPIHMFLLGSVAVLAVACGPGGVHDEAITQLRGLVNDHEFASHQDPAKTWAKTRHYVEACQQVLAEMEAEPCPMMSADEMRSMMAPAGDALRRHLDATRGAVDSGALDKEVRRHAAEMHSAIDGLEGGHMMGGHGHM